GGGQAISIGQAAKRQRVLFGAFHSGIVRDAADGEYQHVESISLAGVEDDLLRFEIDLGGVALNEPNAIVEELPISRRDMPLLDFAAEVLVKEGFEFKLRTAANQSHLSGTAEFQCRKQS